MEWINVKECIPTTEVIAIGHQQEMLIGYISYNELEGCFIAENNASILPDVTHFMYKPQPPKDKE